MVPLYTVLEVLYLLECNQDETRIRETFLAPCKVIWISPSYFGSHATVYLTVSG